MNSLCFALILSQLAQQNTFPPKHIQELLKKRVLHQIKQGNPDLMFNFDEPTCTVVGTYNFANENLEISSNDKSVDLKLPYTDVLEGRTLELGSIGNLIETKQNVIAAHETMELTGGTEAGSKFKKWLPWIAGVAGLAIGGVVLYNSMNRGGGSGGSTGSNQGARTYR